MRVKGFTDGTIAIMSDTFYRLGRKAADAEEERPGCDAVMPMIEKMQSLDRIGRELCELGAWAMDWHAMNNDIERITARGVDGYNARKKEIEEERREVLRDRCRAWERVQRRQKRRAERLQDEIAAKAIKEVSDSAEIYQ